MYGNFNYNVWFNRIGLKKIMTFQNSPSTLERKPLRFLLQMKHREERDREQKLILMTESIQSHLWIYLINLLINHSYSLIIVLFSFKPVFGILLYSYFSRFYILYWNGKISIQKYWKATLYILFCALQRNEMSRLYMFIQANDASSMILSAKEITTYHSPQV